MGSSAPLGPWVLVGHATPFAASGARGYAYWAPLGPFLWQNYFMIAKSYFIMLNIIFMKSVFCAREGAAERPNMNNPMRRVAAHGYVCTTKDYGPSGAELPIAHPYWKQSICQN